MATVYRAIVNMPMDSGLPEDAATNTWHFTGVGVPATDAAVIHPFLVTFYQAIDVYLSIRLSGTATVKYYDLGEAEPRTPIYENTIALVPGAGNPLPSEVALCLSYQGAKVSGVNQARRRGRIYLGPLDAAAAGAAPSTSDRPNSAFITALGAAATALASSSVGASVPWSIYSVTNGTAVTATDGWIDNSFDTQRRRGVDATSRTLWT